MKLGFNAHFREVNAFRGRYRVMVGGAGSGKSRNTAADFLIKLCEPANRGANLLVARRTLRSHRNSTFSELLAAMEGFGSRREELFEVRRGEMGIVCKSTGNAILFAGLHGEEGRESLKSIRAPSGQLTWIWCEEATELSEQDFEVLDDRLRGALAEGLYYQMTLTFNPISAGHWLRRRFFTSDEKDEEVFLHHSSYLDNRFIDPGFHQRMERRKSYDPDGYKVYALGEWGERDVAQILTRYRVEDCSPHPRDYDAMALGMDFGFNHNNAVLLLGLRDGLLYVCDELVMGGVEGEEVARAMEDRFGEAKELLLWCDSASPERIRQLRRLGWRARRVKKEPGSVLAQIDWLKSREIVLDGKCVQSFREMQAWSWMRERGSGLLLDAPRPGGDDAMAALRYGIEGWREGPTFDFG